MSVVSEGTLGRQAACFHVECVLPPGSKRGCPTAPTLTGLRQYCVTCAINAMFMCVLNL